MFTRSMLSLILAATLSVVVSATANATAVLVDWAFNADGTLSQNANGDAMPTTGLLDSSGFGTLTYSITGAGAHSFVAFFDFEIDQATNTFFNEFGSTTGTAAAGQSWEIDEPGWTFGDIYNNALNGTLDNSNAVTAAAVDDVSFALGWSFNLLDGQTATMTFSLADILPTILPTFYLTHTDPEAGPNFNLTENIYFWSDLVVTGGPTIVPAPGALLLMLGGLLGVITTRNSKNRTV